MDPERNIVSYPTSIDGCLIIRPMIWRDERGCFLESWSDNWRLLLGSSVSFVQDNQSRSKRNVLRGLHYQTEDAAQAKLVWVTSGRVFDVVVDLRRSSPSFGKWFGYYLDAERSERIYIPKGCAHGFLVCSDQADFQYKVSIPYSPTHERSLLWDDQSISVKWPLKVGERPILSVKDAAALSFVHCQTFP